MSSLLKNNSAKKVAAVELSDVEQACLSKKIMKDLDNPKSKAAKSVNKAIFEAWGVHLAVENGQLFMAAVKGEDR